MQNMETPFLRATLFVATQTVRRGKDNGIEKTEEANAGV